MKAIVLEEQGRLNLRDYNLDDPMGADDVRIVPASVGICGSDVHYYSHGHIGDFVVREPMILGHEASGVIAERGANVRHLKVGDRVCMEPGIPVYRSMETLSGMYNLDPDVVFWATPPVHGCLRETVVHPAAFTFKLPDNVSYHEGALVEPLAIGMYSARKAGITSGDHALVIGAGTIGIVTALSAEASGCSKVFIADIKKEKLDFVEKNYGDKITVIDLNSRSIGDVLLESGIELVDLIFEASGSEKAFANIAEFAKPGATIVLIGMPPGPVSIDVVSLQAKEIQIKTIFRYVNIFPRVLNMISSGKMNVKPLVTRTYGFDDAIKAIEYAATLPDDEIKIMIDTGF